MWNLKCMAGGGRCNFKTNDLVAMQEHAMNEHNASRSDVSGVSRTTIEDGKHYEFESFNGLAHFDAQKVLDHNCWQEAVPYESDGALGHGWECGICGRFLQAG